MKQLIVSVVFSCSLFAAIPGDTVWEVEPTHTFTSTLSAAGTATLSDSANGFNATMVGQTIVVTGEANCIVQTFSSAGAVVCTTTQATFTTHSGSLRAQTVVAADTDGGGFANSQKGATGVDMTQGTNQAVVSFTASLGGVGTTTLTNSSLTFTNAMLGNVVNIAGQGFYCIEAFTSSGSVTVDRALGTFSSASGAVGGALASLGQAGAPAAAGNAAYVMYGLYTITSASNNVSGGCVNSIYTIIGYKSNREPFNTDPMPTITSAIGNAVLIATAIVGPIMNINLNANSQSSNSCSGFYIGCILNGFTGNVSSGGIATLYSNNTHGIATAAAIYVTYYCGATGNTASIFTGNTIACIAWANTATPYVGSFNWNSVAYGNTGATTHGFSAINQGTYELNDISESNGGFGFSAPDTTATFNRLVLNSSTFGNASGSVSTGLTAVSVFTPAASVFVAAASQDFRLNTTAGGLTLKATAYPTTFPGISSSALNYRDIGALQHIDNAASVRTFANYIDAKRKMFLASYHGPQPKQNVNQSIRAMLLESMNNKNSDSGDYRIIGLILAGIAGTGLTVLAAKKR